MKAREQAEKEAAAADMLVVSMHGKNRLATGTETGVIKWIGLKRAKPCSLVISLDPDAKPLTDKNPSLTALRAAAARSGMAVLLQFAEPGFLIDEAAFGDIQHRATSASQFMDGIMRWHDPHPYPRWGINE